MKCRLYASSGEFTADNTEQMSFELVGEDDAVTDNMSDSEYNFSLSEEEN